MNVIVSFCRRERKEKEEEEKENEKERSNGQSKDGHSAEIRCLCKTLPI